MYLAAPLLLLLLEHLPPVISSDVLMVMGGQFMNTSVTPAEHQHLSDVEIIGRDTSCQVASLPVELYGMTAAKVGDTVLTCGGFSHHYRQECYEYSHHRDMWQLSSIRLDQETGFPASTAVGDNFYLVGGRGYVEGRQDPWVYYNTVTRINMRTRTKERLPDLPVPLADACVVVTTENRTRLWVLGGASTGTFRYHDDVFSLDLGNTTGGWRTMPKMPGARQWLACSTAVVDGEIGILAAGGYYNGGASMWLPLADRQGVSMERYGPNRDEPRWEWFSTMTEKRKWGPGLGYIGQNLAIAGGADYGDDTVDVLEGTEWRRSGVTMRYKREFLAAATVPSEWFSQCGF